MKDVSITLIPELVGASNGKSMKEARKPCPNVDGDIQRIQEVKHCVEAATNEIMNISHPQSERNTDPEDPSAKRVHALTGASNLKTEVSKE